MMWDFRCLIRRGGGNWPRDWRNDNRRPIRPPETGQKPEDRGQMSAGSGQEPEERWIIPLWQPPKDSGDGWKKSE